MYLAICITISNIYIAKCMHYATFHIYLSNIYKGLDSVCLRGLYRKVHHFLRQHTQSVQRLVSV